MDKEPAEDSAGSLFIRMILPDDISYPLRIIFNRWIFTIQIEFRSCVMDPGFCMGR
jgi:hypothetical protein